MNHWAMLIVWLTGMFGLIGAVMAAVARLVIRDTMEHDRRYVWRLPSSWSSNPTDRRLP